MQLVLLCSLVSIMTRQGPGVRASLALLVGVTALSCKDPTPAVDGTCRSLDTTMFPLELVGVDTGSVAAVREALSAWPVIDVNSIDSVEVSARRAAALALMRLPVDHPAAGLLAVALGVVQSSTELQYRAAAAYAILELPEAPLEGLIASNRASDHQKLMAFRTLSELEAPASLLRDSASATRLVVGNGRRLLTCSLSQRLTLGDSLATEGRRFLASMLSRLEGEVRAGSPQAARLLADSAVAAARRELTASAYMVDAHGRPSIDRSSH